MNKLEFVTWKLEENVKKRNDLKSKFKEKEQEYLDAKAEQKNGSLNAELEEKKNFLQELQRKHKEELDELKARHKKEYNEVFEPYMELKDKVRFGVSSIKKEMEDIQKELTEVKAENKRLNREKALAKDLDDVTITSHAVVQYLDRAKNMDIDKIRKDVRKHMIDEGYKLKSNSQIHDHAVVQYLTSQSIINLEEIEAEILPEDMKEVMMSQELVGSTGTFITKGGYRLVLKSGKIVTVLPQKEPSRKRKKKQGVRFEKVKRKIRKMKL